MVFNMHFTFCMLGNFFMIFFICYFFFSKLTSKNSSVIPRVSNSLDPNQARQNVGPDQGLIYLQRLSADDTGGQRVEERKENNMVSITV